ncbi:T9SS type A sorting domain-containing protein [Pontibacter qinzhouensis]|uniref:T9SS type A sorting domain-containing protein n=1 Tax=Pontibacter qinzhouensis TaxID=2603253 RepID=A0A5C8J4B0_9BACT|nr:T9SS type A sorting domain-containing protein [Pontibacter qinzhouensis]TXK29680.1 T9SS type A sorting domain-containing protein [Pontibacter qinzhouensis]
MKKRLHFILQHSINSCISCNVLLYFKTHLQLNLLLLLFFTSSSVLGQYQQTWTKTYPNVLAPYHLQIDHHQNMIVVGSTTATKIDTEGRELWQVNFSGTTYKSVLDESGNIYILTRTPDVNDRLLKLSPEGEELLNYTIIDGFKPADLIVNNREEIFLTGFLQEKALTIKLNKEGNLVWSRSYESNCADLAMNTASILDTDGNLIVTGKDLYQGSSIDGCTIYLVKYASEDGSILLEKEYELRETYAFLDHPSKLLVNSTGIYIIGTRESCCHGHPTMFILKTDGAGNYLWRRGSSAPAEHKLKDAAFDKEGNIILLAEAFMNIPQKTTIFTAMFNSNGEQVWGDNYEPASSYGYSVGSLVILENGLPAVSAAAYSDRGLTFITVLIYDKNGTRTMTLSTPPSYEPQYSHWTNLVKDEKDNLYLGGAFAADNYYSQGQLNLIKYALTPSCPTQLVDVRLYLPPKPSRVGWQVRTTADFGSYTDLQNKGIKWTWGDGSDSSVSYTLPDSPRITGEHTYQQAGIYTVGLNFSESCLDATSDEYQQQIVIYDPTAGFVAGVGEISNWATRLRHMEPGAKTAVAFALTYPTKTAEKPVGALALYLNNKDWFFSQSLDWLVINKNRAAWQGWGNINGNGHYKFVATVEDSGGLGMNDLSDKMRIRIWSSGGTLVYDNLMTGTNKLHLEQELPGISRGQLFINTTPSPVIALQIQEMMKEASTMPENVAELQVYPNPFSSVATISYTPNSQGSYQLMLYDSKGTLVREIAKGEAHAGELIPMEVDAGSLSQGIYYIKLITPDAVKTTRLMLRR